MAHDKPPPSLEEIEARLRDARRSAGIPDPSTTQAGAGQDDRAVGSGVRIGVELVAALLVGVGGGLLIDKWLGSAPWGFLVMFFLGAGAGMMNVYRLSKGVGYAVGYKEQDSDRGPDGGPGGKGQGRG